MTTALHPIFEQALRPFAPKRVTSESRSDGRIHTSTFRGDDEAAVLEAARKFVRHIDPYRSPAVKTQMWDGGEFVVEVRYYTVD